MGGRQFSCYRCSTVLSVSNSGPQTQSFPNRAHPRWAAESPIGPPRHTIGKFGKPPVKFSTDGLGLAPLEETDCPSAKQPRRGRFSPPSLVLFCCFSSVPSPSARGHVRSRSPRHEEILREGRFAVANLQRLRRAGCTIRGRASLFICFVEDGMQESSR